MAHADDPVHGRADFVAHGGEEIAFGARGRFRFFLGVQEFLFHRLVFRDVHQPADDAGRAFKKGARIGDAQIVLHALRIAAFQLHFCQTDVIGGELLGHFPQLR